MKSLLLPACLLLAATTLDAADWSQSIKFPESEKPVALFNGKDLTGWDGNMQYWSVQDAAIVGKNSADNAPKASTYLHTTKKFLAFRLIFEGKLVTSEMHSGVALWGQPVEKEGDPHSYLGHLVMFPSAWGFWDLYRRNSIYKDDGRAKAAGKQHDWNQMEILAQPPRIRLVVNGQLVADWTDPKPGLCVEGPLGLQLHSNKVAQEVQFRGLILAENPQDQLLTVKDAGKLGHDLRQLYKCIELIESGNIRRGIPVDTLKPLLGDLHFRGDRHAFAHLSSWPFHEIDGVPGGSPPVWEIRFELNESAMIKDFMIRLMEEK